MSFEIKHWLMSLSIGIIATLLILYLILTLFPYSLESFPSANTEEQCLVIGENWVAAPEGGYCDYANAMQRLDDRAGEHNVFLGSVFFVIGLLSFGLSYRFLTHQKTIQYSWFITGGLLLVAAAVSFSTASFSYGGIIILAILFCILVFGAMKMERGKMVFSPKKRK